MRKTNWVIGIVGLLAAFALAGCADQTDMDQLNKNEFTLRGMIAADRQEIDALKAQVAQQNERDRRAQAWRDGRHGWHLGHERSRREPRGGSESAASRLGRDSRRCTATGRAGGQRRRRSAGGRRRRAGSRSAGWRTCSTGNSRRDCANLAGRARSGDCRRCELERSRHQDLSRRPRRDEGRQVSARGQQVHQAAARVSEIAAERAGRILRRQCVVRNRRLRSGHSAVQRSRDAFSQGQVCERRAAA